MSDSFYNSSGTTSLYTQRFSLGAGDFTTTGTTLLLIGGISVVRSFPPSTDGDVYYAFHMPNNYAAGTDVTVEICWAPSNTDTGDVKWDVGFLETAINSGDLIGGTPTVFSTTQSGGGTTNELLGIGVNVGALAIGEQIDIQITRNAADVADTFTGDARLSSINIVYTSNVLGVVS